MEFGWIAGTKLRLKFMMEITKAACGMRYRGMNSGLSLKLQFGVAVAAAMLLGVAMPAAAQTVQPATPATASPVKTMGR